MTTIIEKRQLNEWGISSRVRRIGPEKELVEWFLEKMPIKIPSGCRLSVFEEPKIESGFPDLVLVLWDESFTQDWTDSRQGLGQRDIAVMHCLYQMKRASGFDIEKLFATPVDDSLDRLLEAGVITRKKGQCALLPLQQIFAVRRIIAIEAKVSNITGGLHQAALNTWFAHDSILLMPKAASNSDSLMRASQLGVTIFARSTGNVLKPTSSREVPLSYASWLFNEWAWKATL